MAKYGDPSLEIDALHLTHPKCAHTHPKQWRHTHHGAQGAVGGSCLAQGHLSRSIEGGERALDMARQEKSDINMPSFMERS